MFRYVYSEILPPIILVMAIAILWICSDTDGSLQAFLANASLFILVGAIVYGLLNAIEDRRS